MSEKIINVPVSNPARGVLNLVIGKARDYDSSDIRARMPIAVAILSVLFQEFPLWTLRGYAGIIDVSWASYFFSIILIAAVCLSLFEKTSQYSIIAFCIVAILAIIPDWTSIANHTYLAIWTISVAVLYKTWWSSHQYQTYLRITIGIVMLAAFTQKILAGTYIDGSYLTHLGMTGATTERMFFWLCDANPVEPCTPLKYISLFILAWQVAVGILLLAGLNSIIFLLIEIGFLLGAGIYADEMNFQVLNIALLCIIFRYGMPVWLLTTCIFFLIVDYFTISTWPDPIERSSCYVSLGLRLTPAVEWPA